MRFAPSRCWRAAQRAVAVARQDQAQPTTAPPELSLSRVASAVQASDLAERIGASAARAAAPRQAVALAPRREVAVGPAATGPSFGIRRFYPSRARQARRRSTCKMGWLLSSA